MDELKLAAVFWPTPDVDDPEDAVVTVEDGVVVYIARADGFALRLLVHELVALAKFVANEVEAYDEAENARDLDGCDQEEESAQEDIGELGTVCHGENESDLTG